MLNPALKSSNLFAPPGASLKLSFSKGLYWSLGGVTVPSSFLSTVRASNVTTLLPTSAPGAPYLTFGNNVPAIVPGFGLQVYQGVTNLLLNSAAPATQTTASLGAGTYTMWVNGTGSATSSAGTATGSGFGAATNGTPNTFTLTGAGTVVVTVSGSLNAFQLEPGAVGTPLIVTTGVTAARADDAISIANTGWLNASQGTLLAQILIPTILASGGPAMNLYGLGDGAGNNLVLGYMNGGDFTPHAIVKNGGVNQFVGSVPNSVSAGAAFKHAISYAANSFALSVNGGTPSTGTSGSVPTGITGFAWNQNGIGRPFGYVQSLTYFPSVKSVQALTQ